MTDRKYELDRWYPRVGGLCPVPEMTTVDVMWKNGAKGARIAKDIRHDWENVVAFCVTEYPPQEETRTGKCWAYANDRLAPALFMNNLGLSSIRGTYTVTTVDGKLTRILWEADQ